MNSMDEMSAPAYSLNQIKVDQDNVVAKSSKQGWHALISSLNEQQRYKFALQAATPIEYTDHQ